MFHSVKVRVRVSGASSEEGSGNPPSPPRCCCHCPSQSGMPAVHWAPMQKP